jgi:hypothetical protein
VTLTFWRARLLLLLVRAAAIAMAWTLLRHDAAVVDVL